MAAAAGAVLIVSLFGPWYEAGALEATAWEAFSIFDVLLVVSGMIGLAVLLITASQRTAAVGLATESLAFLITGAIAVAALLRVLNLPGDLDAVGAGRTAFAWIGVLAAFGVSAASLVAMRDERISKPGRATDPTGVPIEKQAEVELLPAPPRGSS